MTNMVKELKKVIRSEVNQMVKKNNYKKKIAVDETRVTEVKIGKMSY